MIPALDIIINFTLEKFSNKQEFESVWNTKKLLHCLKKLEMYIQRSLSFCGGLPWSVWAMPGWHLTLQTTAQYIIKMDFFTSQKTLRHFTVIIMIFAKCIHIVNVLEQTGVFHDDGIVMQANSVCSCEWIPHDEC